MNKQFMIWVVVFVGLIGILSLLMQSKKNTDESLREIVPTISPQQVEYYIDRNRPMEQLPTSTPTQRPVATNAAVIDTNSIAQKYEQNYPYNRLFPFTSSTVSVSYRLEPKRLYVSTVLDDPSSLSILESYLKKNNLRLSDLQNKGVSFIFERADSASEPFSRE